MFNSLFGSKNQIYIYTDKPSYFAGEIVEGTVVLNIISPMHVEGIYLKLKGYQYANFEKKVSFQTKDANGKPKTESTKKTFSETDSFFRRKVLLSSIKNALPTGTYTFPFSFTLDSSLPATFTLSGQSGGCDFSGKVLYKVKAEVAVPGLYRATMKHKQQFVVNEPTPKPLSDAKCHKEVQVTCCFCISRGKASIFASVDKNAYEPGDVVSVRLVVDNSESSINLPPASIKLIQVVELLANNQQHLQSSITGKASGHAIAKKVKDERFIQIPLSMNVQPTTKGTSVRCQYFLEVVQPVPGAQPLVVKREVQVFLSSLPEYKPFEPPANWNPTSYPTVSVTNNYQQY